MRLQDGGGAPGEGLTLGPREAGRPRGRGVDGRCAVVLAGGPRGPRGAGGAAEGHPPAAPRRSPARQDLGTWRAWPTSWFRRRWAPAAVVCSPAACQRPGERVELSTEASTGPGERVELFEVLHRPPEALSGPPGPRERPNCAAFPRAGRHRGPR